MSSGRLDDDRVAARERRSHFPAGEHQRKIPRHDLADDADRFAVHIIEEAGIDRRQETLELVRHPPEIAEASGGARNVQPARVAHGVARVRRLDADERLGLLIDRIRKLEEKPAALGGVHSRPAFLRRLGGINGGVHVLRPGLGDLADQRIVVRIRDRNCRVRAAVDEFSVDEQLRLHVRGPLSPRQLYSSRAAARAARRPVAPDCV